MFVSADIDEQLSRGPERLKECSRESVSLLSGVGGVKPRSLGWFLSTVWRTVVCRLSISVCRKAGGSASRGGRFCPGYFRWPVAPASLGGPEPGLAILPRLFQLAGSARLVGRA